jgi:hypothetical protein
VAQDFSIIPSEFHRNEAITLTVKPGAGMDFSGVKSGVGSNGVAIIPSDTIGHLQATPQENGDLRVEFTTEASTLFGTRTLVIIGPDQLVMASGIIRCVPGI